MTSDDRDICGVGWFSLSEDHPFTKACRRHDDWFRAKEEGRPTPGRRRVDDLLLREMLYASEGKTLLTIQAYIYFGIAKVFGRPFWISK